jgi:hypothetical protein
MIYIVDEPLSETSHSASMQSIILKQDALAETSFVPITKEMLLSDIANVVYNLISKVTPADVVLCAWATRRSEMLNMAFRDLSSSCWVVVAAGNSSSDIRGFSPASADNVYVVGTLNKSGARAALSNFSETVDIHYVTGTNYHIDNITMSGTSVSAAIFAALLNESLRTRDCFLLQRRIEQIKLDALMEISNK